MATEHVIKEHVSVVGERPSVVGQASVVGELPSVEGQASVVETSTPQITIIPGLKELSKNSAGIAEGCDSDKLGLTQENCVADVESQGEGKEPITKKRDNYTTTNTDKMPNHFLWDPLSPYEAPPELNNIFPLKRFQFFQYILIIVSGNLKILAPKIKVLHLVGAFFLLL